MSDRDETQPGQQNQDDELDVEELEEVAGGGAALDEFADSNSGCNNCPNTNCPC